MCCDVFCPSCFLFHRAQHSKPADGTSGAKKGLSFFPVSEGHKLIQNFLQSLEPPFLVGGCPSISPLYMRAIRFINLGYFFPKFLDTL
jgi:hypothetical protein